jgi:1-acyl-sn-glycerol-3-phosphate acyltransferase
MAGWLSSLWYEYCYWGTMGCSLLGFSLRFEGSRHIPQQGPVLLIGNHQSYFDPVVIGLAAQRRHLHYLARKTLFRNPAMNWLLSSLNAVPVDQHGVAKEGLKVILNLLQEGKAVLIFPEGERSRTGQLQALKPGVLLLIHRTGAPIVPVGIAGAYNLFPRHQKLPYLSPICLPAPRGGIAVSFGRPLEASRYADMPREQALTELFDRVAEQMSRAERLRRKS